MSYETSFNDAALARSLGTNDPTVIATARSMLGDPDGELVLRFTGIEDDNGDPVLEWADSDEEIERIVATYVRRTP